MLLKYHTTIETKLTLSEVHRSPENEKEIARSEYPGKRCTRVKLIYSEYAWTSQSDVAQRNAKLLATIKDLKILFYCVKPPA
jgi:hypothetical protein